MKKTKFTLAFLALATLLFAAPAAVEYYDGVTQKFNPSNARAGFNFGSNAADPTTLNNGDAWVNSTTNLAKIRLNGVTVPFVTGSTSTGGNGATDAGKIVLFGGEGQITASASSSTAVNGIGTQYGGYFSGNTIGLLGDSGSGTGLRAQTTSGATIASFYDDGAENTRFAVQRDGTLKFDNGAYTVHPPLASGVLLTADETDTPSDGQTPVWNAGAGKILWETPAAGTGAPGGANGQLQWNNSGVFDGISGATTDGTNVTFGSGNLRATIPYITTGLYDTNGGRMLGFNATGSALYGVELTNATSGGSVLLKTTPPNQGPASVAGTPLVLQASDGTVGTASGTATGGTVLVKGGKAVAFSGTTSGGTVTLQGGDSSDASNNGATVVVGGGRNGAIDITGGPVSVGQVTISTADNSASTTIPKILIKGGRPTASNTANASGAVEITTQTGGNTTGASTQPGAGGPITITLGSGGAGTGSTSITGGTGGVWSVVGGAGGAATGSGGTHTGGKGSDLIRTAGTGGMATSASGTRTGGNGGDITETTGTGGAGSTTNGSGGNYTIVTGGPGAGAGTAGTTGYFCVKPGNTEAFRVKGDTSIALPKTITASGTTGAQTINKTSGRVNFAAGATSLVVTNSLVDANSIIILTVASNDTTMKSAAVVAGAGSFTIYPNANPTAETAVNFILTN